MQLNGVTDKQLNQIELLNYEGPVLRLRAVKHNRFELIDQWNKTIAVFNRRSITSFLFGLIEIADSKGRLWNYVNESKEAKPSDLQLSDFLKQREWN